MPASCRLCAQPLQNGFLLTDMPNSAQGFAISESEALSCAAVMEIYQCSMCGLVQYPGPLVPYYKEVIRASKNSNHMIKFRKAQFQSLIGLIDKGASSVFELGCGEGDFLDLFRQLGLETAGVEGSKILSKGARAKGHDVTTGFVTETKMPERYLNRFDILASFNFIEHLPDPLDSLREVSRFLRPGGVALLEVPNYDMILKHHLFNEFIPDHRFYFTQDTFNMLLSQAGFSVTNSTTVWDGYIISVVARKRAKQNWAYFENTRQQMQSEIEDFFSGSERERNAVWSAGHQSLATLSNLGIHRFVSCIIDSAPTKQGKFAPASGLPIFSPEYLEEGILGRILLLAAGFNTEIIEFIRKNYGHSIEIAALNKGQVERD